MIEEESFYTMVTWPDQCQDHSFGRPDLSASIDAVINTIPPETESFSEEIDLNVAGNVLTLQIIKEDGDIEIKLIKGSTLMAKYIHCIGINHFYEKVEKDFQNQGIASFMRTVMEKVSEQIPAERSHTKSRTFMLMWRGFTPSEFCGDRGVHVWRNIGETHKSRVVEILREALSNDTDSDDLPVELTFVYDETAAKDYLEKILDNQ